MAFSLAVWVVVMYLVIPWEMGLLLCEFWWLFDFVVVA